MPLVVGNDRLIPGFEDHLLGLRVGDTKGFDITFPDDYGEASLAGQQAHFEVEVKEHRAKVPPALDDAFARELGPYESLDALRDEIRAAPPAQRSRQGAARVRGAGHRLCGRQRDPGVPRRCRRYEHPDAQGLPPILVEQETEVMHDEFRSSLARQGITEEAYTKVTGQSHEDLHNEFRPQAEKRVMVLLVLSRIAETENVVVPDAHVEAEVERARVTVWREQEARSSYFDSPRGRTFIRSTLRRSRTVEQLIDDWLAAHPEHPPLPHADDDEQRSVVHTDAVAASASVEVTDPGSLGSDEASGRDAVGPEGSVGPEDTGSSTAPEGAAATTGR